MTLYTVYNLNYGTCCRFIILQFPLVVIFQIDKVNVSYLEFGVFKQIPKNYTTFST